MNEIKSLFLCAHTACAGGDVSSAHTQHPHAGLHAGQVSVMTSPTHVCTTVSHSADWSCDVSDVVFRDAAAVTSWITDQLKALCVSMTTAADEQHMQHQILSSKKFPPLRRTSLPHTCLVCFIMIYIRNAKALHKNIQINSTNWK